MIFTEIQQAAITGNLEIFKQNYVAGKETAHTTRSKLAQCMAASIKANSWPLLAHLIDLYPSKITNQTQILYKMVRISIKEDKEEILTHLLQHSKLNKVIIELNTSLACAVLHNRLAFFKLLVDHGAQVISSGAMGMASECDNLRALYKLQSLEKPENRYLAQLLETALLNQSHEVALYFQSLGIHPASQHDLDEQETYERLINATLQAPVTKNPLMFNYWLKEDYYFLNRVKTAYAAGNLSAPAAAWFIDQNLRSQPVATTNTTKSAAIKQHSTKSRL